MSIAITDEQRAVQEAIRQWAVRARPTDAVRAQEPAGVGDSWDAFADLGLHAIALPEDVGGAGGSALDLAAALEEAAAVMAGGPLLPTALAGLLLAPSADAPAVKELLPRLASGEATAAVALEPAAESAAPVLCAGETTHLPIPAGGDAWSLVETGDSVTPLDPVDFSRSLGAVRFVVPLERSFAGTNLERARDLAATLCAAEAAGVARWCLRTAVEHAKTRRQFGRPIGSFQAVKHLCAQMLCRVEQASAVAWDAARAADHPEHPIAAAAAASVALDAAVDNAKDCVQVLGGIGFTWEHDAHLYLRRALALRQLLGGSAAWRIRAAELALGGARRELRLDLDEADPSIRAAVASIAALPDGERRRALADSGYLTPHWPAPYGLDATPATQLRIDEELARAGVSRPELGIGAWAAPTILRHGDDAQRARFAGPTLRGEITWCQLFSEPEAGSDLASLRTRAVRLDGGWRLSGQKVWTSLAHQADWAICLARTNPDVAKHKGITCFLVAMDSPGLDIRPLREITGESIFNEVFLDEVFVPDDCVVGAPGAGWRLARATLANERVAMGGGSALGELVEELLKQARSAGAGAGAAALERLGGLVADGAALSLLGLRETLRRLRGDEPGPESSVRKLVGVAHRQAVAEAALDLAGPDGAADGPFARQFLLTRCLSIAGGTTQILMNV
ncbi:MAG: acyl-CoA dehydrogenase, partial [Micromonosporaceae bacterium]|nr:acyl-CoA dehydrogenase [Micromonosporaceae bacterium]